VSVKEYSHPRIAIPIRIATIKTTAIIRGITTHLKKIAAPSVASMRKSSKSPTESEGVSYCAGV